MKKFITLLLILFISISIYSQNSILWGVSNMYSQIDSLKNIRANLFSVNSDGSGFNINYQFKISIPGRFPSGSKIIDANNGNLYGVTRYGGKDNHGTIFSFNPTLNSYFTILEFDGIQYGRQPFGGLVLASNGKLYGTTLYGGTNDYGVLFEIDPTSNSVNKLIDFNGSSNGRIPVGDLIEASSNILIGITGAGGTSDRGTIYTYDINTNFLTKKYTFPNISTHGFYPDYGLIKASNDKFYGLIDDGGLYGKGVLYEYDLTTNSYSVKFNFQSVSGEKPNGILEEGSNNKLYGVTFNGGILNEGVIFEYDFVTNTYLKKYDFQGSILGRAPTQGLSYVNNSLYGIAFSGANGDGLIFNFDPFSNNYTIITNFYEIETGSAPSSKLFYYNNKLYGLNQYGGGYNEGTLYSLDILNNNLELIFPFNAAMEGSTAGSLILNNSNGKFYGTSTHGGVRNHGVLYEFDPINNLYSKKIDFKGNNGRYPSPTLLANNNKIFGTTSGGGDFNYGTLYEYDIITENHTILHHFNLPEGISPQGHLQLTNDKLYGVTTIGGLNYQGVLYEYDLQNNIYTEKINFSSTIYGSNPVGGLMIASNNKIYGTTRAGGVFDKGVLFQYDPITNIIIKKHDFSGSYSGDYSRCILTEVNNILYGTTALGGSYDDGVLFEFNLNTDVFDKIMNFNDTLNGRFPGSLLKSSNGKLYGMAAHGGLFDDGIIYEINPINNSYSTVFNFNRNINGFLPYWNLAEITFTNIVENFINDDILIFPNPTNNYLTIEYNTENKAPKQVEILNVLGKTINIYSEIVVYSSTQNKITIPTYDLPPGIYFLRLYSGNIFLTKKFIKN